MNSAPCRRLLVRGTLRAATVLGVAILAFTMGRGVAFAAAPEYRSRDCGADYARIPQKVLCATLIVDETRGSADHRRVSMPVVVVKALHPRPGAVPVIYLHG